jgi:alpha-glucosidase
MTAWWQSGIIYEIYPRSFQDSNGDGVGDLCGINQRLDELVWLGIAAIWIAPIYPSPMADFGYDITDYCNVDPLFGSLSDFDALITQAHARGLKIILDFVPNHTSDRHPWFTASRSSRFDAKRDWYIWHDGKDDGSPPNNWISQFGGPAWTYEKNTGQYYLHSFLPQQPDLNWRNPAVRAAMQEVLRFWLDRGVDGFRVDVLWLLIKDAEFRDNPPNPDYRFDQPAINQLLSQYNADQPEVHAVVAEIRAVIDQYPDRVLIGEVYLPLERLVSYYGKDLSGAHLPFNFQLINSAWNAGVIAKLIEEYECALPPGGWPNWVLGNHDQPRIAARVGPAQARIAAMLLLSLRGTPTMYYGDELGIGRVNVPQAAIRDPWERREPGRGFSRDPERTPYQWDGTTNAGFTSGQPWLPIDESYRTQNFKSLRDDPRSILQLYHRLIALRREYRALNIGNFRLIEVTDDIMIFERRHQDECLFVLLNFGQRQRTLSLQPAIAATIILLSTYRDRCGNAFDGNLRPDEGVILEAIRNRGA